MDCSTFRGRRSQTLAIPSGGREGVRRVEGFCGCGHNDSNSCLGRAVSIQAAFPRAGARLARLVTSTARGKPETGQEKERERRDRGREGNGRWKREGERRNGAYTVGQQAHCLVVGARWGREWACGIGYFRSSGQGSEPSWQCAGLE